MDGFITILLFKWHWRNLNMLFLGMDGLINRRIIIKWKIKEAVVAISQNSTIHSLLLYIHRLQLTWMCTRFHLLHSWLRFITCLINRLWQKWCVWHLQLCPKRSCSILLHLWGHMTQESTNVLLKVGMQKAVWEERNAASPPYSQTPC